MRIVAFENVTFLDYFEEKFEFHVQYYKTL